MRAIAARQDEGLTVFEIDVLARDIGQRPAAVMLLIRKGIDAGFIYDDMSGAITLTEKGGRWCDWDEKRKKG